MATLINGGAPPIIDLVGLPDVFDAFVAEADPAEIQLLIDILRHGTAAEQEQAVKTAFEIGLEFWDGS